MHAQHLGDSSRIQQEELHANHKNTFYNLNLAVRYIEAYAARFIYPISHYILSFTNIQGEWQRDADKWVKASHILDTIQAKK